MITAATSAKIAMQIVVTNQNTKSIRPACLLAACGSHGIRSATSAAPAPQTAPIATSWTTDPLRTGDETTGRGGQAAAGSAAARNSCYEQDSISGKRGMKAAPPKET